MRPLRPQLRMRTILLLVSMNWFRAAEFTTTSLFNGSGSACNRRVNAPADGKGSMNIDIFTLRHVSM